ncbi:hypothetical protein BAUCODRAFT_35339 [Baudoinia panamericana UAMH 10762]|uniref:Uncharacterized protein n=1 Tax=Baudoinia panamericana (strain UAMH 10762) TaxID=717646 RepID=M2N954_BAUPA|nr:uncharacterized protein BAUCODRAFT_35339 [Baudoinia panamericana UAMH 10762]EMC95355.1 hypothetical protein BAUCODRAFT_35339 [Baudoinia panamericana UAMH 10762]
MQSQAAVLQAALKTHMELPITGPGMSQPTHWADYTWLVTKIDREKGGRRIVSMRVLMLGMKGRQ